MQTISKFTIIGFGLFFISAGIMMFFAPDKVRETLRKAGSTNLINYGEITIRMIPAAALIIYAQHSKFPELFKIFGWFMLTTSLILFFVPKQKHHDFSLLCAEILKPFYFQLISPISALIGVGLIYCVV